MTSFCCPVLVKPRKTMQLALHNHSRKHFCLLLLFRPFAKKASRIILSKNWIFITRVDAVSPPLITQILMVEASGTAPESTSSILDNVYCYSSRKNNLIVHYIIITVQRKKSSQFRINNYTDLRSIFSSGV